METIEVIKNRVSTRLFDENKQISEDNLNKILEAGMQAPVGSGAYDTLHLTVIQNKELLNEISETVNEFIFKMLGRKMDKNFHAPTMIIVSSKPSHMPGMEYANSGTVVENMAISATSLGIDNIVWAAASAVINQTPELKNKLNIPDGYSPTIVISLGYAVNKEEPKKHNININRV